ncbi:unnamed protein product [Heligmosomoides polygyrus]|uniref:Aa_trans domain-containing protein n=1 Tax=Heligmosomoides polygyrus TaxID=6339 RepID=A0A183F5K4_HELPZ|nr:unnamed protein product [Heligmosomoides polygyrus]
MVFAFYAESVCFQHVADPVMASARWSPVTMFTCALSLTYVCYSGQGLEEHSVTSGVIITVSASIPVHSANFSASVSLTSSSSLKCRGGELIGMSDTGIPLFAYKEVFLQKTNRSPILFFKVLSGFIYALFLCATSLFVLIEALERSDEVP